LFFIKTPEGEDMRRLSTLTSIAGIGALLTLMAGHGLFRRLVAK
jgi:hypothetical protein